MPNLIRFLRSYIFLLLIFHNSILHAQAPTGTDALWSELEEQIQRGNRRALRDLATFLDKPSYAEATRRTLMRYTFFTKKEINIATVSREDFLGFFYENQENLKFSEILKAFYKTPIEEQVLDTLCLKAKIIERKQFEVPPSVKRYILSQKFDSLCQKKIETSEIQYVIEKISDLKTVNTYDWLRRTLASEPFGQRYSDVYLWLCEGLKSDPTAENIDAILGAVERGLVRQELLSSVFLDMTNVAVSAKQARQLLDTLGSLEAVRASGYDCCLSFKSAFFYEKVDYYGKIISTPNVPHWIKDNALYDLLETHHPRLLFFLAAQVRLQPHDKEKYMQLLQKLTNNVLVFQENGNKQAESDIEKWKNYVHWWSVHYDDFEWDNTTKRFISRTEMVERTEEIERLVRRLGSSNDSVAVASFKQLTENDPSVVVATMDKFRPLLRSYNTHLPEINYPYLENMTLLVSFCRANNIHLDASSAVDSLSTLLSNSDSPKARYILENQLIESLTLQEVSAFEYNGLLYSSDMDMNFSISRILDIFYSNHWQEVISDNAALRLYVKKSVLFDRIGAAGSSSMYDRKLDKSDNSLRTRLEKIARSEADTDIRQGILIWLNTPPTLKNDGSKTAQAKEKDDSPIEEKIELLESSPEVQIEEINDFVLNTHYSENYRLQLLRFLKKVAPLSTLRLFKLKNYLTVRSDLPFFADMVIAPKDLDDFLSIFTIDSNANNSNTEALLWPFINTRTAQFSIDEQGSFWNSMFKVAWFNNLINEGIVQSAQKDSILISLRNYLRTSELLSDFEEQTTQRHIAELENIGRSLTEKLESAVKLDASNSIKTAVQSSILSRVSYKDIAEVASISEQLSSFSVTESPMRFLQTDFGIPIFSDDKKTMMELVENHKKLSPKDFYSFYLKQFGLNLWRTDVVDPDTSRRSLDFEKIYNILKHESVIPFTGGGGQRDYFTYGVIKLLEFEFGTRLGFHEKLNENQTFYTFNTSKRAAAWRAFLIEKKLVKIPPSVPPSFKS